MCINYLAKANIAPFTNSLFINDNIQNDGFGVNNVDKEVKK